MDFEELLKSDRPPKKDEITDEDLARLFMKYKGLLKQWERDKAFSAATHENIRIAYAKLDELVEERTAELRKTNEQLKQAEARLGHLNLVLRAIRNVNQLIIKEKDRDRLLKGACDNLIKTRGYYNVWLAIWNESGGLVATAEAGLGRDFLPMVKQLKSGELSACCQQALEQATVVVIKDHLATCGDCPLKKKHQRGGTLAIRLEHNKKIHGLLVTSVPAEFVGDEEEQSLFREVAGDIAFALHDMELEEARQRAERAVQEAREYAEAIVETVWEPLVILDAELRVISANRSFYQTFKVTPGETEGRFIYELGNRQWDIPALRELLEQILPWNARFDDFEVEHDFPTIGRRVMLLNARRIYREANKTQMILLAIEDITERRRAEEALRESERRYRTIFETTGTATVIVEEDTTISLANSEFEKLSGYSKEELENKKSWLEFVVRDDLDRVKEYHRLRRIDPDAAPKRYEFRFIDRGGNIKDILLTIGVIPGTKRSIASLMDITERKRAQDEIRKAKEQAEQYLSIAGVMLATIDADENITLMNKKGYEILGYKDGELIGKNWFDTLVPERIRGEIRGVFYKLMAGDTEPVGYYENPLLTKGGEERLIAFHNTVIRDPNGKIVGVLFSAEDITEYRRARDEIKRAAEEWRTTFDSISDFISIHDRDFRLTRVNRAFADVLKMKPAELIGKSCYEVVHGTSEPVPDCPHKKTLDTKEPATAEFFEPHLGIHLEVSTSPIFNEKGEVVASVHVSRDITERKEMEKKLMITDRLASIGELASGIAHELNNPLTGVIGFSQLLLDKDVPDDVKEDVKTIYSEAQRAAGVVKNLLTFARRHTPVKQLVDINSVIDKVLELRAYEQRVSNIQVNTRFAADLPEVMADHFQLQQVFLNIIINAEHFMIKAHNGGTLTITTEKVANNVRASFADDGPGISRENLGHVFDPFFTTKEVGEGTGLGLSICHGIIAQHDGRIYAESELGKGATFIVELPATSGKEGA